MNLKFFLTGLTIALLIPLTSFAAYKMESGLYTMSIILAGQEHPMPKAVTVTVSGKKVSVISDESDVTLKGSISGDTLLLKSQSKSINHEFKGKLVGHNKAEGSAVQLSKGSVQHRATFTLSQTN